MKKLLLLSCILLSSACSKPVANQQTSEESPADASPSPYAETLAVLDAGGVNYQLMDGTYEWEALKPMVDFFSTMVFMGIKEASPESLSPEATETLKSLPQRIGLNEMLVRGSSTIERPEGGYLSKYVIQKKADAKGWVWHLSGKQIDIAKRIRQLPDTTVLLSHYAINAPLLHQEIKKELAPFPQAIEVMSEGESFLKEMNFPLEALLNSIHQGISFGLTLNDQATWNLPIPNVSFSIPETGFVIMLPDENSVLLNYLIKQIEKNMPIPLLLIDAEVEGITVKTLPVPAPVSTAVSLQMVNLEGVTLFATAQNLMQQLIQRRDGNLDAPLLDSLKSIDNTQASFALIGDTKIEKLFDESTEKLMGLIEDEEAEEMMGPMLGYYKSIFFSLPHVTLNRNEGDLNISGMLHKNPMSPQFSGNTALTVPMVGGLLAAIAIPSFTKARESAQEAGCINNLRILDSVKQQIAIEQNLAAGSLVTETKISTFLRSDFPVCPQGGAYSIHPIDTLPACSLHGSLE